MRSRIPQERRRVRTPRGTSGRIHRAFGQRVGMQSRLPEARRVVRRGRGAFKRLPRLVGTRLGLRARLQERTPLVPGLPGANERSPRFIGKQLDLRSGLSAAGRDLHRGQGVAGRNRSLYALKDAPAGRLDRRKRASAPHNADEHRAPRLPGGARSVPKVGQSET